MQCVLGGDGGSDVAADKRAAHGSTFHGAAASPAPKDSVWRRRWRRDQPVGRIIAVRSLDSDPTCTVARDCHPESRFAMIVRLASHEDAHRAPIWAPFGTGMSAISPEGRVTCISWPLRDQSPDSSQRKSSGAVSATRVFRCNAQR